jgi:hypothetical protein
MKLKHLYNFFDVTRLSQLVTAVRFESVYIGKRIHFNIEHFHV